MATTPEYFAGCDLSLSLTLQDQTGAAINLTGATVTLKLLNPAQGQAILPCTITDATTGSVSIQLTSSQLAQAGDYQCQAVIVQSGLTTATTPFTLTLQPQIF